MKAFKIKKKISTFKTFIIGPSIGSLPKPKIPRFYFKKIHKPVFYNKNFIFEVQSRQVEQPESIGLRQVELA